MAAPHTEVVVQAIPDCDICKATKADPVKPAEFDGATVMGSWAYMCNMHYGQYGIGVGLGRGQKLILAESGEAK